MRLGAVVAIALGCGGGRALALSSRPPVPAIRAEPTVALPVASAAKVAAVAVDVSPASLPPVVELEKPLPKFVPRDLPKPLPKTCRDALTAASVRFSDAMPVRPTPTMPIVDAVLVTTPIHGVTYRYAEMLSSTRLLLDCQFALRLVEASDVLAARGIREVVHLGAFEPRCMKGGLLTAESTCVPSTHALGMALDVAELVTDDARYVVTTDFVRRPGPTCSVGPTAPRDAFLKDLVCALDGTFSALLTPNYDAKHRSHVHLDLQPPTKTPWACGVDPPLPRDRG